MELVFKLKQHTPIIHFQHYEKGATLRATELKPKLDRYLRKYMPKKDETIRYQLKVKPLGKLTKNYDIPKLYFGNQGDVKKKKRISHSNGVELTINTYFDKGLENIIKEVLPVCLALENFGTRQNKGFGCFYLDNSKENIQWFKDQDIKIETVLKNSGKPMYYFDAPNKDNVFNYIDVLYKAMKPGINETRGKPKSNAYLKSFLWQYLNKGRNKKKGNLITWEKRFMKQKLLGFSPKDPQYFRVLLGLCDTYTFKKIPKLEIYEARSDNDYGDTDILKLGYDVFKVMDPHNKIKRFKSPITFKPIDKRVYIILEEDGYKELLKKSFQFKCRHLKGNLKVPNTFSLKDFMDFVMDQVNNKKYGVFEGNSAMKLKQIKIGFL